MFSVNRKCEQSITTDERRTFTKVLGADKKVHRDQTLGNTGGNNKDNNNNNNNNNFIKESVIVTKGGLDERLEKWLSE